MLYIDLILSLTLFIMGILSIVLKSFRPNPWVVALSLLFFPIAVVTYYFPDMNLIIFGNVAILDILIYPFAKVLVILTLVRFMRQKKDIP